MSVPQGGTRVGQEAERTRGKRGPDLSCGFQGERLSMGKEWALENRDAPG